MTSRVAGSILIVSWSMMTFCLSFELERARRLHLGADLLHRGLHVRQPVDHGRADRLGPVQVVVHHLQHGRVVQQPDGAGVPARVRLQRRVLGPLLEEAGRLHDLDRQGRGLEDQRQERVGVEGHPDDQGVDLVRGGGCWRLGGRGRRLVGLVLGARDVCGGRDRERHDRDRLQQSDASGRQPPPGARGARYRQAARSASWSRPGSRHHPRLPRASARTRLPEPQRPRIFDPGQTYGGHCWQRAVQDEPVTAGDAHAGPKRTPAVSTAGASSTG